jgi:hypothetical protein
MVRHGDNKLQVCLVLVIESDDEMGNPNLVTPLKLLQEE